MKMSALKLVHWLTTKLPAKARRSADSSQSGRVDGERVETGENAAIRSLQETVASDRGFTPGGAAQPPESSRLPVAAGEDRDSFAARAELPADEPEFIDHFEIRRVLGQGGFGSVYLAHDTKLDRMVALKLLDNLDKQAARRMLEHETRAASKLKHPNLVTVFQTGEYVRGCYIVFEYIPGPDRQKARTLREVLRDNQRIPPREAVAILRQISSALAYAHDADVVHRDIKPENILIDYKGTAFLADFGCARRRRRHAEGVTSLVGTLPYMSLEQINGQWDAKTDIWSTGIVLYEILAGARPFAFAEKVRSRSAAEAAYSFAAAVLKVERLPSIPGIDADLDAICRKCLEKDVDQRYDSANALVEDLARWQRNEPVSCRPVGIVERTRRWTQRNPLVAAQLGTIALILVVGFMVSMYFAVNMWRAREQYVAEEIAQLDQVDSATFDDVLSNLQKEPFRKLSVQLLSSRWQKLADDSQQLAEDPQRAELLHRVAAAIVAFDRASLETQPASELVSAAHERLQEALLTVQNPEDFRLLRKYFVAAEDQRSTGDAARIQSLWTIAENAQDPHARFRALAALTDYDHDNKRWSEYATNLVHGLLDQQDEYVAAWADSLSAVGDRLVPVLKAELGSGSELRTTRATIAYSILASTRLELLKRILSEPSPAAVYQLLVQIKSRNISKQMALDQLSQLAAQLTDVTARQLVNLTVARLFLGGSSVGDQLPIFDQDQGAEARYLFEKDALQYGLTLNSLHQWLRELQSRRASLESQQTALLAMGRYDLANLPENSRKLIRAEIESIYARHRSARVHSSAEWLLNRWNIELPRISKPAHDDSVDSWRINRLGQLMVRINAGDESAHEITAYEITLGDYAQYVQSRAEHYDQERRVLSWIRQPIKNHQNEDPIFQVPADDERPANPEDEIPFEQLRLPVRHVSALQAVAYCVWASQRDGIAEDEMCFRIRDELQEDNMTLLEAIERQLSGLHSPLEACERRAAGYRPLYSDEWEQMFPPLNLSKSAPDALRNELGWHKGNAQSRIWPVGGKRPNSLGIFDVYGNVTEWCIAGHEESHIPFETLGSSFESDLDETRPITPEMEVFGGHRAIGYRMIRRLN